MEPYWFGRDGEALSMFDALYTIKAGGEQIGNSFSLLGRSPCWWRRPLSRRR